MENNHYIYTAEKSSNEDGITLTPSWKSMKFFEKIILRIFAPYLSDIEAKSVVTKERIDSLSEVVTTLSETNQKLSQQVDQLAGQLNVISQKLNHTSNAVSVLIADHNTKKASIDSKYKDAINLLYHLNDIFGQYVPQFGRASELQNLQMLVNYLYCPSKDLRKAIVDTAQINSRTSEAMQSILAEIDNFNMSCRDSLDAYLNEKGTSWVECVTFPEVLKYDADNMSAFNDSDIESEAPVYVVSLGLNFPNSNSEKTSPVVIKRKNP